MLVQGPHSTRAAPEILDRNGQGRILIMIHDHNDENSYRT
jgi:hypothetical protein